MLRFFRNIRKSLLGNNKFSKYLLYAVGEILLVVIGILIALQVDSWNETRKDQLRVRSHLEELKIELSNDLTRLEEIMTRFEELDEAGLYLNKFLTESLDETDTLKLTESYLRAGHLAYFGVTAAAYNNLVSSGDINHIENDSIKRLLGVLHSDDEWSKKYISEGMVNIYNTYHNYLLKHTHPLIVRQDFINSNSILGNTEASIITSSINWENVKKDSTYKMLLDQVIANRIVQKLTYLLWKEDIVKIVEIINAELDN
jgi:hypothetical protein